MAKIGPQKQVKVAIYGIKCIDLTKEALKILGVFFSYEKNLQLENNFRKTILNIERIVKLWRGMNRHLRAELLFLKH